MAANAPETGGCQKRGTGAGHPGLTLQEPRFVQGLFGAIARRYDLANHLLSGGLDFLWRRRAARIVRGWQPERIVLTFEDEPDPVVRTLGIG